MRDAKDRRFEWSLRQKLLRELEIARSRFAVAVAAESKRTPTRARRHFMETELRILKMIRALRLLKSDVVLDFAHCLDLINALECPASNEDPGGGAPGIEPLCHRLNAILEQLECFSDGKTGKA